MNQKISHPPITGILLWKHKSPCRKKTWHVRLESLQQICIYIYFCSQLNSVSVICCNSGSRGWVKTKCIHSGGPGDRQASHNFQNLEHSGDLREKKTFCHTFSHHAHFLLYLAGSKVFNCKKLELSYCILSKVESVVEEQQDYWNKQIMILMESTGKNYNQSSLSLHSRCLPLHPASHSFCS